MKKKIYLKDESFNWKEYEYSTIDELKEEFTRRNISIGNRASIGNGTSIGNDASIGNRASIGNDASIGYGASIGNGTSIDDGIKLIKNFYIVGSKHPITYIGNNTLSIGCHNFTIDKWKECFKTVGEKEGYSNKQIEEYYQYILMAEQFAKIG